MGEGGERVVTTRSRAAAAQLANSAEEMVSLRGIDGKQVQQKQSEKTKMKTELSESELKAIMEDNVSLPIVWRNILLFIYLHAAAAVGFYMLITGKVMFYTFLWGFLFYCLSGFGITAGVHRYWSHRSYKAKTPLRIILAACQTLAFQNSIYEWCRDHRVHHKFTETNADPHDARRGFFFAHIGWLLCRKHDAVKIKGKTVDLSDLDADPIVTFQKKYYLPLVLMACFVVPTAVPIYFWGESFIISWFFSAQFRYCITLHMTWLVNSAAHLWGPKPYDKRINPAENISVAWLAFGEGWHNYHHVFPWDYKTAEIGQYRYNFSAAFIDFFAKIGWAYDLKSVPEEIVKSRVARTGDGSHAHHHGNGNGVPGGPWGWGDKEIPIEDKEVTEILHPLKHNEK